MASTLKKVIIVFGALGLAVFLMFAALIAWFIWSDDQAKAKATALCDGVAVGSPADAALARAKAAGSTTREPHWLPGGTDGDELLVVFSSGLPLAGYLCTISAKDGVVTAARVDVLD